MWLKDLWLLSVDAQDRFRKHNLLFIVRVGSDVLVTCRTGVSVQITRQFSLNAGQLTL